MIVIIDYGMGNLRSVLKAFTRLGIKAMISSDIEEIKSAKKLVLPGVGHFRNGMNNLVKMNILDILGYKILVEKTPILGICLGMQLFSKFSDEGNVKGLGWIDSRVIRLEIDDNNKWKIPHMGWNSISKINKSQIITGKIENSSFYFVHSYHVVCQNKTDIISTTNYNIDFTSIIEKDNIYGVQFHPEKSYVPGLQIIKNFSLI